MLFANKEFSWLRHALIAITLLTGINLLVIFAPNILGIFGVIGERRAHLSVQAGGLAPRIPLHILQIPFPWG